jgi:glucose/arabinose dehydrogenase
VAATSVLITGALEMPVDITAPRLDPRRLFVIEQRGRIRIIKDGALIEDAFLDIDDRVSCCGERGLLGLDFHPDFETNGRFFVDYTNNNGDTVVARYRVGADPDRADRDSEIPLFTIAQPFSNHNGGQVAFGPDGYLYVGMGDGGGGGDPRENAQNDDTLLGKLLRVDVDVEERPYYRVPPDNPHPERGDRLGLIWSKGWRNPWRFSFDRVTNDLYIADVGQGDIEEIDVQPAGSRGGENYGWDIFEGSACFEPDPFPTCPDPPDGLVFPVLEYPHSAGRCSVTGGFVYRGCALPDLAGHYFFADYCTRFLQSFMLVDGVITGVQDRADALAPGGDLSIDNVSSFGEDARGELFIADYDGEIYQVVPAGAPVSR